MADTRIRSNGASSGAPSTPATDARTRAHGIPAASTLAPPGEHQVGHPLEPEHRAGRTDELGEQGRGPARPRPDVEHPLTRPHVEQLEHRLHGARLAVGLAVADVERPVVRRAPPLRRGEEPLAGLGRHRGPRRAAAASTATPAGPRAPSRRRGGRSGRRTASGPGSGVGTRACTAVASIESTSPPIGPTDVAPTRWPAARSSTSLMIPSPPGPVIQPRVDPASGARPTATSSPASRACCSVRPTEPTSGSVKVTRGTAWYSASRASSPVRLGDVGEGDRRLVHRHVREGALAGDVADRPQLVAGPHPRVGVDRAGLRGRGPTESSPTSARLGRRPAATSSRSDPSSTGGATGVGERHREPAVGVAHRADRRSGEHLDAVGGHRARRPPPRTRAPRAPGRVVPPRRARPWCRTGRTPGPARPRSRRRR